MTNASALALINMSGTRIEITDLLTGAVTRRDIDAECDIPGLAVVAAQINIPVQANLVLSRIPEGVVARGTFSCSWLAQCSICLEEITGPLLVEIDELFEESAIEGDTYPIIGNEIDLDQLIRDTLVVELPLAPSCGTATCANFSRPVPELGVAASDSGDPRWSALSELEF